MIQHLCSKTSCNFSLKLSWSLKTGKHPCARVFLSLVCSVDLQASGTRPWFKGHMFLLFLTSPLRESLFPLVSGSHYLVQPVSPHLLKTAFGTQLCISWSHGFWCHMNILIFSLFKLNGAFHIIFDLMLQTFFAVLAPSWHIAKIRKDGSPVYLGFTFWWNFICSLESWV